MPNLYFVIVMLGMTTGTVGPLPYDKAECESRAAEYAAAWDEKWREGLNLKGQPLKRSDVQFRCEYHLVRPVLDPRAGP
jgi:hypothetical protein